MLKRRKAIPFVLAGLALLVALPGWTAPRGPVSPAGPVLGVEEDVLAFLKRTALADACQGGTCQTGLNGVLNCPTTGGPTCASSQPCGCICMQMPNGSWSSANYCFSA